MTAPASAFACPPSDTLLEPAPPEVKRYQRQKLAARVVALLLSLAGLAGLALWAGPRLEPLLVGLVGESRWLRLVAVAVVTGLALEILTLPLSVWSGFVLEHRYGLSNQTLGAWVWRQIKGYLVAEATKQTGRTKQRGREPFREMAPDPF